MDNHKKSVAKTCLKSAEDDSLTFPQIVGTLMLEGFEGYTVDFRRALATYYTHDGDSVGVPMHKIDVPIALAFDAMRVQLAVREAQQLAPGYRYLEFCNKIAASGCAGYIVSFPGRRVLYVGRTAETHVEYFPD